MVKKSVDESDRLAKITTPFKLVFNGLMGTGTLLSERAFPCPYPTFVKALKGSGNPDLPLETAWGYFYVAGGEEKLQKRYEEKSDVWTVVFGERILKVLPYTSCEVGWGRYTIGTIMSLFSKNLMGYDMDKNGQIRLLCRSA